nr:methylisocitrate lyase [Nocardioides zeae]
MLEARSTGRPLRFPGAFTPLSSRLIQEHGFDGAYISGAVMAAERGLPDIGLTTLTEVTERARDISAAADLPTLVDADTGFGEPMNAARTTTLLEAAGVTGFHLEDQVNPKRCGHLDGKQVVDVATMKRRIRAAVSARTDAGTVICARTDARAVEGFDAALDRAKAYVDAGADMIFPEALANLGEYERFAAALDVPVLANMTEFGKGTLHDVRSLGNAGVALVIYPVTLLRLAMGAVEKGLARLSADGTQAALVPRMQSRARLYELLGYAEYAAFDQSVFDFAVPGPTTQPPATPGTDLQEDHR